MLRKDAREALHDAFHGEGLVVGERREGAQLE